jgi:ectoine hydroxylase-related dioxygenase (phytanoyl-CoA dioxygenase family)
MEDLRAELAGARSRETGDGWLTRGNMIFRTNLFFHSSKLQSFISQEKIVELLRPLIGADFWVRWDQAVAKQPGGVEFPWHQDNAYNRLATSHFQLWVAVTSIRRENGALWLDPGSHRRGRLPHRFVGRDAVYDGQPENPVLVEAEAGDVIVFSSLLLHRTSPNHSEEERWAYVVEYMPLDDFDPYLTPPYFVAARDGRPAPHFVRLFRGRLRLRNQIAYLLPRLSYAGARAVAAAKRLLRDD